MAHKHVINKADKYLTVIRGDRMAGPERLRTELAHCQLGLLCNGTGDPDSDQTNMYKVDEGI